MRRAESEPLPPAAVPSPAPDAQTLAEPAPPPADTPPPPDGAPAPGGSRELLNLAYPLILSSGFMTVQVFLDTVLLAWHDPDEMAASFPAVMWFWVLFALPQVTAGYTSTFVAQYTGAGRPKRIGPVVWQGIHFSVVAGLLFLVVHPLAPHLIGLNGHPDDLQRMETAYLRCLCFAALPMLVMGAVNGFFSGRGQTWTVLAIEGAGTAVNVLLALVLIFGEAGVPRFGIPGVPGVPTLGIVGAGWATVGGSWAAALVAVALFLRRRYRVEFDSLRGWRPDRPLFARLMKYGGPAGAQWFLDALVFNLFTQMVGGLGAAAMGATTLAVRLNMVAFLPMLGMGQAVSILVGQRLGENRPDLAERSTYTGLRWVASYMAVVAASYLLFPRALVAIFESDADPAAFEAIAAVVPSLLVCVAIYSLADAVNVTFAFALRGAGDTRFVTVLTFALAWPIMVLPTWAVAVGFRDELRASAPWMGEPIYWAWAFATAHILAMAVCFTWRFRGGKWKAMRVIEQTPVDE